MERSAQTLGDLRMLAVVRQRTGELVGVSLVALLLTVLAECGDARRHVAGVVQSAADHVRDIGEVAGLGSRVEILLADVSVDDGSEHAHAAAHFVDAVVDVHDAEDLLGGCCAHLVEVVKLGPVHDLLIMIGLLLESLGGSWLACGHAGDGGSRHGEALGTHDHSLVEEAAGDRGLAERTCAATAAALSEDHDIVGIASELCDVLLDPLEGLDLVHDAVVAGGSVLVLRDQVGMRHESEHAEAVVDGHEDHVLGSELVTVELGLEAPAFAQSSAMDPHGDRKLGVRLSRCGRIDVEVQAVLAVRGLLAIAPFIGIASGIVRDLESGMAEPVTYLHTLPRNDGLRLFPAQLADRRSGIRYALVHIDTFLLGGFDALDLAAFDGQDRIVLLAREQCKGCR